MSTPPQPRLVPPPMRRSAKVALVLLGTAGAVGVAALAVDAWQKSRVDDAAAPAPQPPPPVSAEQTYANDAFLPGAGYYHAPYHGWFPFPYNYHDPARGYYAGGLWQAVPFVAGLLSSRPSADAVAAARRAQEQQEQQQRAQSASSGYGSRFRGTGGSGSPAASRPSSAPPSSGSRSIQRGGFGGSGHGSGGST